MYHLELKPKYYESSKKTGTYLTISPHVYNAVEEFLELGS
jgi:hypothetical protein